MIGVWFRVSVAYKGEYSEYFCYTETEADNLYKWLCNAFRFHREDMAHIMCWKLSNDDSKASYWKLIKAKYS